MKKKCLKGIAIILAFIVFFGICNPVLLANAASNKTVTVKKIQITRPSVSTLTLQKGKSYTIKYSVTPADASNKKVTYKTSNKKVATVSSKGKITAKSIGTAKITIKAADKSKKSASLKIKVVKKDVKISSIKFDKTALTLEPGKTYTLKPTIKPRNASNKKLSFKSSDTKVASVSSKGVITAKEAGTAKITVKAMDGSEKSKVCTVTVKSPKEQIKVTKVTLDKDKLSLLRNEDYKLTASVTPSNATNSKLSFESSDSKVATVSSDGTIHTISSGTVTITAKATDGSDKSAACVVEVSEYAKVFEDNFDGNELNMSYWNYEKHEPGWVNNELQRYTDSKDNIYVEDGKLVIKANKSGENSYTSGKITTAGKKDFKYGKFEIKAKLVDGQGLWPAIWMMPRNEEFYGTWPVCGEIDIMEELGNEPNKVYQTIHYGNPHTEKQGTYTLRTGSFADDYHVYGLEWEPGEMRFYVDGNRIKTVNDWYCATAEKGDIAYPAPFNQYFYLQLNLAVGGDWPHSPDATTDFDKAKFMIDYVRVYQKESYNENVTKPKTPNEYRDPDSTGNYILNGDFSDTTENFDDNEGWIRHIGYGAVAVANIVDNELVVTTTSEGTYDYDIQIYQPGIPLERGTKYKVSFNAYAASERSMNVAIFNSQNSVSYMGNTAVSMTTEKKAYSYEFTMMHEDDPNAVFKFHLGNQGSTAAVHISDVRLVKAD